MIRLYTGARSGNSHKIALFLSILGVPHETVEIPYGPELRTPEFLAKNPRGQVPVLEADGTCIWDSMAILVYLARAHGGEKWLPLDAAGMAGDAVAGARRERASVRHRPGAHHAALSRPRGRTGVPRHEARAVSDPARLDRHGAPPVVARVALALDRPTIAEMACYTYPALNVEAEIDMTPYPAIRAWMDRVRALPGFIPMIGT